MFLRVLSSYYDAIELVNGEKYLDSFFKLLINVDHKELTPSMMQCTTYNSLGTPLEYRISMYWVAFLAKLASSK